MSTHSPSTKKFISDKVPFGALGLGMGVLTAFFLGSVFISYFFFKKDIVAMWEHYSGGDITQANSGYLATDAYQGFSARQAPNRERPRLQVDEEADIKAYKTAEKRLLEAYEWVDESKKVVRIPVAKAMELLAEE